MSNPLSSLKKSQKNPLYTSPGQRSMPFRNPNYTEDEHKLLDEITTGMATARSQARDPFVGGLPKIPKATINGSQGFNMTPRTGDLERSNSDLDPLDESQIPSDHELMSTMMTRITQLEAKLAYQSKEMNEKDKKIRILTDKVKLLQSSQDADSPKHVAELENKCYVLQQQIQDMETFLADYGMIWVGEKMDDDSDVYNEDSDDDLWRPASSVSQQPSFQIDYTKLLENIKDLNTLAGDGVAKITHTKDGARLKMPDPIQLTLYANGLLMFNGPFRPYTDPSTRACVQDMLDGYFPSELQKRYPDGVPFDVTDRREVYYEDKLSEMFTGQGQTLGGETKPSRLVPTKLEDRTTNTGEPADESKQTTNEKPGPQLTVEQFLQKLPKSVVRAGKVIDIRNNVGETLQGGPRNHGDITVIETDTVQQIKNRLQSEGDSRPYTPRNITTLRVKSEDGNHTYILKMKFSDTVGDLRKYIINQRGADAPNFDIMSAYPNKTHTDDSISLQEAGLTPNAVAHLKIKK